MRPKQLRLSRALAGLVGVGLVILSVVVLWQREYVVDWLRVNQYQPTAAIEEITDNVKFSDTGQFYFYASQPSIDGTQNFNQQCQHHEKSVHVLGCYANRKIYLYDVNNPELAGIEEVTAAHEMLHAAYDRLSTGEQEDVNRLLIEEESRRLGDKAFVERMKAYRDLPRSEQIHEYHSIFATELPSINPELEQYYSRYFEDRRHVVSLHEQYSGVFRKLLREAEGLASSLDSLAITINQRVANYNQASASLSSDIASFNRQAQSGGFGSEVEFNSQRQQLLNRSNALDQEHRQINLLLQNYEDTKKRYNGLARHLTDLNNSIDSSLAPAPTVN